MGACEGVRRLAETAGLRAARRESGLTDTLGVPVVYDRGVFGWLMEHGYRTIQEQASMDAEERVEGALREIPWRWRTLPRRLRQAVLGGNADADRELWFRLGGSRLARPAGHGSSAPDGRCDDRGLEVLVSNGRGWSILTDWLAVARAEAAAA